MKRRHTRSRSQRTTKRAYRARRRIRQDTDSESTRAESAAELVHIAQAARLANAGPSTTDTQ